MHDPLAIYFFKIVAVIGIDIYSCTVANVPEAETKLPKQGLTCCLCKLGERVLLNIALNQHARRKRHMTIISQISKACTRGLVTIACISSSVFMVLIATEIRAQGVIALDLQRKAQSFAGFGANIWPGDLLAMQTLDELGMKYARLDDNANFYYFPAQPPTDENDVEGDNFNEILNFIEHNFDTPDGRTNLQFIRTTSDLAKKKGVQLIQTEFHIPRSFVDANNALMTNRIDDLATYWAAMFTYLKANGVHSSFVELSNEPNGNWSGYISPSAYDSLVIKTRRMLDLKGHQSIGIVGPGLSVLGTTNWIAGLSPPAVAALGSWSAHTWDDNYGLDSQLSKFMLEVRKQDPTRKKRVFMTEFATNRRDFNGVRYTFPETGGNAADQSPFAVWVLSNIATLVNNGVDTLVFWDAVDQVWSKKTWGLRRLNGTTRPTYDALKMLSTALPADARVLEKSWQDPNVNVAAFHYTDRIVLCLTNTSGMVQNRNISLVNASSKLQVKSASQFHASVVSPLVLQISNSSLNISLLPESAQVVVLSN